MGKENRDGENRVNDREIGEEYITEEDTDRTTLQENSGFPPLYLITPKYCETIHGL